MVLGVGKEEESSQTKEDEGGGLVVMLRIWCGLGFDDGVGVGYMCIYIMGVTMGRVSDLSSTLLLRWNCSAVDVSGAAFERDPSCR